MKNKEEIKMKILQRENRYNVISEFKILDFLEPKNYILNYDQKSGDFFLEDGPEFKQPDVYFDDSKDFRQQILTTFKAIDKNVGVALNGRKGTGKTLTAKQLALELNLPVIMITKPIPAKFDFIAFLSTITQPHVLFIDEFEKKFYSPNNGNVDKEDIMDEALKEDEFHTQSSFLSYMDGNLNGTTKKLFLLTSNNSIDVNMINRPSRVRYFKNYEYMSQDIVNAIIDSNLKNKDFEEDLKTNLTLADCTFDLLFSIIDEINIHNKPYSSFRDFFNHINTTFSYEVEFKESDKWEVKEVLTRKQQLETVVWNLWGGPTKVSKSEYWKMVHYDGSYKYYQAQESGWLVRVREIIIKPEFAMSGSPF